MRIGLNLQIATCNLGIKNSETEQTVMIVVKILGIILWMFVLPFCIGLIPLRWIPKEKKNIGVVFIAGYVIMLPMCWLVTVPAILFVKYDSFLVMVRLFTVGMAIAAAAGVALSAWAVKKKQWVSLKPAFRWADVSMEEKIEWFLFLALIAFQLYKAFTLTSFDGDDAEYVAQSLVTQQSNTMYLIKPYTGGTTSLDIRHSLAVLPIWIAYVGRMTGIHTTILAHSVIPFVFIPLTYVVYFEIGKQLLRKKKEFLPAFMVFMALLQTFGNVSIYTNETFFLTRTWQGKSLAANFVLPLIICLLLWIFDKENEHKTRKGERLEEKESTFGLWLLLWLANMTAGVCTSMVVFLGAVMIAVIAFWMMIAERKFSVLIKAGIVCIPNVAYMILYLLLHV